MNFTEAVEKIFHHEGGYVNDPNDRGGETNYGITVAVARNYGFKGDMKELPKSTAADIYKANYWDKCKCDELPESIRYAVFDTAVNMGSTRAIKFLQQTGGCDDDGFIGPNTIAASKNASASGYMFTRIYFYCQIVRRDKSQAKYIGGWSNRAKEVLEMSRKHG
ncbi:MAG: glycosyl hydrolase 108 family protein [Nitrosopumilus sp.]